VYHVLQKETVICSSALMQWCQNKYLTSLIAKEYQPDTYLLKDALAHHHIQERLSAIVVLKPLFGSQ
jgi:glutathione synthase/RimK-type ligase-like ATP-grasp enzyme